MASLTDFTTFVQALNTLQNAGPIFDMIQGLSDGVHEGAPVLAFLNANAKTPKDGGDEIKFDIINQRKPAQSYYKGSTINRQTVDFVGAAILETAYYVNDVNYYKTDLLRNKGKDKFMDYVAKQIDLAKEGMTETLMFDIYGTDTLDVNGDAKGIRPIVGLELAVETNPAGAGNTYAGVLRTATSYYWNNQAASITNLASLSTDKMKGMMQACAHMGKVVDLIVMSDPAYRQVWNIAKSERWLNESAAAAELGFPESIKFGSAAIIPDKYLTGVADGGIIDTSAKRIWFLNTKDGLEWRVDASDDMNMGEVFRPTGTQIAFSQEVTFSGQLVIKNPRMSGVLYWS